MSERAEMFNWPEVKTVIPEQHWVQDHSVYGQHRLWSTDDYRLVSPQDYTPEDYDLITSVAEGFCAMDKIADFKASVTDPAMGRNFRRNGSGRAD